MYLYTCVYGVSFFSFFLLYISLRPFIGTTATLSFLPPLFHFKTQRAAESESLEEKKEILLTNGRRSGGGHVVKIVNTEKRWLYRHIDRHTFTHGATGTRFFSYPKRTRGENKIKGENEKWRNPTLLVIEIHWDWDELKTRKNSIKFIYWSCSTAARKSPVYGAGRNRR